MSKLQYFETLKNDGYYIRIEKGRYKQQPHTAISICKDIEEGRGSIACYINRPALTEIQKELNFNIINKENVVWLNHHDSMDLKHTGEPMKITFHS